MQQNNLSGYCADSASESDPEGGFNEIPRYIYAQNASPGPGDNVSNNVQPENEIFLDSNIFPDNLEPDYRDEPKLSVKKKTLKIGICIARAVALLGLLYFFVCSLDLLSLGFRLIGGRTAGDIFRRSEILQNPVVGVMIGILTTILVQSSSTSTSIIVSMVASKFLDVRVAVYIIMGCNIGTSITNTIVALSQAGDREIFRRAFAGATILDMFNWLTVAVLLLVEVSTGFLYYTSKAIMTGIMPDKQSGGQIQLLSVLTKPFVNLIVQLDKSVLECWSTPNCTTANGKSLILEFCGGRPVYIDGIGRIVNPDGVIVELIYYDRAETTIYEKCNSLFAGTSLSDVWAGIVVLLVSLVGLCLCLYGIVKVLSSVLQGHMAELVKRAVNADIPKVPWLTGYIAILIGAFMTFVVQSSSVFTSALTPLVGLGVITLKRMYPLTLGSNLGTTTTAIFASMAAEGDALFPSMQIALCHFLFNLTGILLFYPIPVMRIPIAMAQYLGDKTAKYRWFAIAYMVLFFGILPVVTISLSIAGPPYVISFLTILGVPILLVLIINFIRSKIPNILPAFLQSWKWLPKPLRSLEPYDACCIKLECCKSIRNRSASIFSNKSHSSPQKKINKTETNEINQAFQNSSSGDEDENRIDYLQTQNVDGKFVTLV